MELGQKPVTDFKTLHMPPLDTEPAQLDTITHPNKEGMQDDKADSNYPQTIPEYILPTQHKPQHHRPELIRAVNRIFPAHINALFRIISYYDLICFILLFLKRKGASSLVITSSCGFQHTF
jgi:hypothetical protein